MIRFYILYIYIYIGSTRPNVVYFLLCFFSALQCYLFVDKIEMSAIRCFTILPKITRTYIHNGIYVLGAVNYF